MLLIFKLILTHPIHWSLNIQIEGGSIVASTFSIDLNAISIATLCMRVVRRYMHLFIMVPRLESASFLLGSIFYFSDFCAKSE